MQNMTKAEAVNFHWHDPIASMPLLSHSTEPHEGSVLQTLRLRSLEQHYFVQLLCMLQLLLCAETNNYCTTRKNAYTAINYLSVYRLIVQGSATSPGRPMYKQQPRTQGTWYGTNTINSVTRPVTSSLQSLRRTRKTNPVQSHVPYFSQYLSQITQHEEAHASDRDNKTSASKDHVIHKSVRWGRVLDESRKLTTVRCHKRCIHT